ncbi:hypothetical protein [Plantibacter sp. 2H11-2]|uniref:hypothetical protein n=1 Tax=Plantibacter sp. 2H11-2 TaxID=3414431 RepID=UPI003CF0994E
MTLFARGSTSMGAERLRRSLVLLMSVSLFLALAACGSPAEWVTPHFSRTVQDRDRPSVRVELPVKNISTDDFRLLGEDPMGNLFYVAQAQAGGEFCLIAVGTDGESSAYECGDTLPLELTDDLGGASEIVATLRNHVNTRVGGRDVSEYLTVDVAD